MQSFTDIGCVAVHNSIRLHASADVLDLNRFLLYFVRFLTSLGPSCSDYGSATAAGVSKYLLHRRQSVLNTPAAYLPSFQGRPRVSTDSGATLALCSLNHTKLKDYLRWQAVTYTKHVVLKEYTYVYLRKAQNTDKKFWDKRKLSINWHRSISLILGAISTFSLRYDNSVRL